MHVKLNENTRLLKVFVDMEVRDVIFHPYLPVIFSCGDGKMHSLFKDTIKTDDSALCCRYMCKSVRL
jgi:hypothetical protein